MIQRQITHQNIVRVLISGFSLVILLLVAAAVAGVHNIQSIQQNAASLMSEQAVTNRLINELQRQQTSLSDVFSIMARDPDSLDYSHIMRQLEDADRDIDRITAEGRQTPERDLWTRLQQASVQFSQEARRILSVDSPETFAPIDLFRDHEHFISVVERLMAAEYRKVAATQAQIDRQSSRLHDVSLSFAAASVLLSLLFAVITVRMASQLVRRLESQTAELGRVSWHMLEDQEVTARRFSHELHDELGQSLTAVKTNLAALDAEGSLNRARLEDCLHLVDDAIGNVRQMSQLLHPTILDDFGLEAAIRWLAESFRARTGVEVDLRSTYSSRLPEDTEIHLFRIAQEALTNVARHAAARHVRIQLEPRGGDIYLSIHDDGRGLPANSPGAAPQAPGVGMIGMRARARGAGGDIDVRSRPGEGVLIEVRVPLKSEVNAE